MVTLLDVTGMLGGITAMAAAISAVGLGLISLHFGWHTPRAYVWRNPFSGMRRQAVPAHRTRPDGLPTQTADAETVALPPGQASSTSFR